MTIPSEPKFEEDLSDRLAAEIDDLMKANALLHALIGNREAEIERAYDQLHNEREDAQAEIERLRAVLNLGGATLALFNIDNYHPTLVALQAQLMAGLEQKSPP